MKKYITDIRTLGALLIAVATMTACSGDNEDIAAEQRPVNPAKKTYTLTVNASKGGDAATRALAIDGSTITATWATDENIYVMKESTWATGSLQPETAGATATLKGTLSDIEINNSDELTLQFPKSGDISYAGQLGTLADIATNFDWSTASVTVTDASTANITTTDATFTKQQAIIKFILLDKANSAAISPSAFSISDGTNTVELTSILADTYTANGGDNNVLYVAFPAVGSEKAITLTATVGDDTYTYEKSGVTFTNGKYYEITVKMKKITDLSMVDCAGNARASRWTANCYMVHTAGKYKLPLVYGNAIKAGAANTVAYYPGEKESTLPYCANFVNHADVAITSPWIKDNKDATNNNITVTQAELLWQDAEGLITAVGIDGDYLTLTVGKNADEQEGNALIAAKDASGTIVWSWQIWVTKQTFAAATLTAVNTGSHTYSVTPVNLGWVGDATSATGYNTFYEWGRKDPFMGKGVVAYVSNNTATIADNIKNPTTFYIVNTYKPSTAEYYNLWDAHQTSKSDNIATPTVKTVYDPSPAGFCVPTGNLYKYIRNESNSTAIQFVWDDENKGRILASVTPNLFFPAAGYRARGQYGSLDGVGTIGYYWAAHAWTTTKYGHVHGQEFYFISNQRQWNYAYRANGFSVRAVAEETSGESPTTSLETNRSDYGKADPIILD